MVGAIACLDAPSSWFTEAEEAPFYSLDNAMSRATLGTVQPNFPHDEPNCAPRLL